ncbi:MAG: hypothetical protein IPJ19_17135 [Planctomycetes bacterium]|nr:hypothetical protein [Planctomycetota bacterium]
MKTAIVLVAVLVTGALAILSMRALGGPCADQSLVRQGIAGALMGAAGHYVAKCLGVVKPT